MNKEDTVALLDKSFRTAFLRAEPNSLVARKIRQLIEKMDRIEWETMLDFVYDCIKPGVEGRKGWPSGRRGVILRKV